jgi:AcrR family transcriptional regulator
LTAVYQVDGYWSCDQLVGVARRGASTDDDSKQRDPERTRARILRAATELFTRMGPAGASLDEISRKAGVQRGLIYHYFKTKESLFEQALTRPLTDYLESHLEFLQIQTLDVDGLCQATSAFFRFLGRQPELVRVLGWVNAMGRVVVPQLDVTRALFGRTLRRIEEAKASGALRADLDSAHLLITVIDLSVSWHLTRPEWSAKFSWTERDPRELDEERLTAILGVVRAIASPTAAAPAAHRPPDEA